VQSKRRRRALIALSVLAVLAAAGYVIYGGGRLEGAGTVSPARPPPEALSARRAADAKAAPGADTQILFGDLHVHTTFSADAFLRSLPLLGGEGAHPPADACDFARYCSQLDFFAITDHAEGLTPRQWSETKESVRQCNAVAGAPESPDIVAFTGWEWSQVGMTPDDHYGHKNVIFPGTKEDELPARPIGAGGAAGGALRNTARMQGGAGPLMIPILDFDRRQRYLDLGAEQRERKAVVDCPSGVPERDLPLDCRELAATPAELFDKLRQWGMDSLVIPHGTTWGFYTPPGYTWDKQLSPAQNDPGKQRLVEVYSGHGNSEQYRSYSDVDGDFWKPGARCPAPTAEHEPCCHRAGEIIRARCGDIPKDECEARVEKARRDYLAVGVAGHLTVPGATADDWKDCGQCRDCFNPAFNYRPGGSVQYILAKGDFTDPARPAFMPLGLIASSDNHSARPGTGYKELGRRKMGEATGAESEEWRGRVFTATTATPTSEALAPARLLEMPPFRLVEAERQASFFMTGGLVAVHARGRSREAVWDALKRREVYGTSGDRILLWFDLVNAPGGKASMGSEVRLSEAPRLVVRAAGSFEQKPGCPDWVQERIGKDRLDRLCLGECFHAADRRRRITRIEVVRIRPQRSADEDLRGLIQDAWKTLPCPEGREICEVEFEDTEFATGQRDVVYYVRAIQEPTSAVNAGGLRCEKDASGQCARVRPCYGDYRTPFEDDCLSPNEERAWSSPIFVRHEEKRP
jgi:hypothetical protein